MASLKLVDLYPLIGLPVEYGFLGYENLCIIKECTWEEDRYTIEFTNGTSTNMTEEEMVCFIKNGTVSYKTEVNKFKDTANVVLQELSCTHASCV